MDWLDKCECIVSYYKLCDDLFHEIIFVTGRDIDDNHALKKRLLLST